MKAFSKTNKKADQPQPEYSEGEAQEFPGSQHLNLLNGLAQLIEQENLSELEVEDNGVRLTLRTAAALAPTFAAQPWTEQQFEIPPAPEPTPGSTESTPEPNNHVAIEAPMVGVFYHSPSPSDPPFIEVGGHVEAGQTVGIIEAMKVFNEITSEVEGTVVQIVAGNAELVETGNTLVLIQP